MREEYLGVQWLRQYHSSEPRLGLERVEALLELVDNPHLKLPVIHIAGTNGKGSTVAHLAKLLEAYGQRVGIFSSPYIQAYEEQFLINFEPIPTDTLQAYIAKYQQLFAKESDNQAIQGITEFELLTVLAYDYFADEAVDYVIMETGLGGLLDSTNVCRPVLTGITTIGLDHTAILGDTLEEIAQQKAGIIKADTPLVTGRIEQAAYEVIVAQAAQKQAPLYGLAEAYHVAPIGQASAFGQAFVYQSARIPASNFTTPLLGLHQADNAGMAIRLFEVLAEANHWLYNDERIQEALSQTWWPGRMEEISKGPRIIIDGAHNPHALARLKENLASLGAADSIDILFACINTKALEDMLALLHDMPYRTLNITTFAHEHAFSLEELSEVKGEEDILIEDWRTFVDTYLQEASPKSTLLITGSLYFISQVRKHVLK